ncbi:MAG: protein translocase subunit SecD [Propionicimonas sp.]|nr:protein translocase subunit SecD [Propionicimonas sp.]
MATTSRKHHHPVRTLVVFGLVIAALYAVMGFSGVYTPKLGLDLRGGTTITLTASNVTGQGSIDRTSLELARTIIQQRVDSMGVGETEVTTSGDNQIVVSVPNVQADELVEMVGKTAQLYFRKVFSVAAAPAASPTPEPSASPEATEPPQETVAPGESASPEPSASPTVNKRPLPQLPTPVPSPRPTAPADPAQTLDDLMAWEPSDRDNSEFEAYTCGEESPTPSVVDQPLIICDETDTYKYLLGPALIQGNEVSRAYAAVPQGSVSWQVQLEFTDQGAANFNTVTTHLSTQTEPQNQFAIVLDDAVISAPSVENPIPGGRAEISGSFTQASATSLANVLTYGALPLSFEVSSVDNVSAKLGGEQLVAGMIAGLIGLALVVLYSLVYYRALAIVVVASLAIAAAITYVMMVLLGQGMGFALNLPGIAGAIMAIGVTADSFIIYFERIRDEVREGRSLRTAIETGWERSRKTILVADSVSLLSAVVLFVLAIGAVKGFAFTLGLTTLIDIAIVFWFTKPFVTLLGHTKFFGEGHRFSGFEADHLGHTNPPLHNGKRRPVTVGGEA